MNTADLICNGDPGNRKKRRGNEGENGPITSTFYLTDEMYYPRNLLSQKHRSIGHVL